jgi:hypothetical protein
MARRSHEGEDGGAFFKGGLRRHNRSSCGPQCGRVGSRIYERVAGTQITRCIESGSFAPHECEILWRMNAHDLFIRRIARRQHVAEQTGGVQPRLNDFYALGPLGVRRSAQMIPAKGIGDELQPVCLAGVRHEPAAAF